MSITSNEIKLYKSTNSNGGAITDTEVEDGVLSNLFDKVTSDESLAGATEYRCAYIKNVHASIVLEEAISYLSANTLSPTTNMFIGVGTSIVGAVEQTVLDDYTAPIGITWVDGLNVINAITLGDIPAGSHKAIWFKRVVGENTSAAPVDGITLTTRGSTV